MATLALGLAGAALATQAAGGAAVNIGLGITAAGFGAAVGGSIGSIIDGQFLFPTLFGKNGNTQGPRLDDLQISVASEGARMPFIIGKENRVGGTIIWMTDLIEVATTTEQGGKGGPSQTTTSYSYYVHMAASFGECAHGPGLIRRVWLDTKVIYELDTASDAYTSTLATIKANGTATTRSQITDDVNGHSGAVNAAAGYVVGYKIVGRTRVATSPVTNIVVDGLGQAIAINDTVKFAGHSQIYTVTSGCSAPGGTITISPALVRTVADNEVIAVNDIATPGEQADDIRLTYGTLDQTADSLISSYEGADVTSAYIGEVIIVFENLNLADWGNRPPQVNGEVAEPTELVSEALRFLCLRSGLTASQVDVSRVYGCIRGYTIVGPQQMHRAIEALMQVYDIAALVDDGVVTFWTRGFEDTTTVTEDDLTAGVQFRGSPNFEKPTSVSVTHIDPDRDLQQGSQVERRMTQLGANDESLDVPFTMSAEQARLYAQRRLYRAWAEKTACLFKLKPKWAFLLQPGDHITLTYDSGSAFRIRCETVTRGQNLEVEVEGIVTFTNLADNSTNTDDNSTTTPDPYTIPALREFMMDLAPLTVADAARPVMYAAAGVETGTWKGASVARDLGSNQFDTKATLFTEAKVGALSGTLGAPTTTAVWDFANSFTVTMSSVNQSLSSKSKAEVLNGENHFLIGGEVVGVLNCVLQSSNPNVYLCTGLLRGVRNTSTSHSAGESLVALEAGPVQAVDVGFGFIGNDVVHRIAPTLAPYTDADELLSSPFVGYSVKPWEPTKVESTRNGSDDVTVTWNRRTRIPTSIMTTPIPLDEPFEKYEVRFVDAGSGTTLRTKEVEDAETVTYTAAEQTSDGITPGDLLDIGVLQVGNYLNSEETLIEDQ